MSDKIVEIEKKVTNITIPSETIAQFCQRYHIQKLSFFGSVLRADFSPESDIDILVEFDPKYIPGLIRLSAMELELSEIFQRKVDLRTPEVKVKIQSSRLGFVPPLLNLQLCDRARLYWFVRLYQDFLMMGFVPLPKRSQ